MNLAHIWLDTKRDTAILMTANISSPEANQAFSKLAKELYTNFILKKKK